MHFTLIDRIIERSEDSLTAVKQVTLAEEYLQDHFPGFEVLPGVMMIEALTQAARALLADRAPGTRLVLGEVRALKYGTFVRPGHALTVKVTLQKETEAGYQVRAEGTVDHGSGPLTAVSGRLTLRPVRLAGRIPTTG